MSSRPSIERFLPRELGNKPWGTEVLIAETPHYIGKVLCMKAGKGGNLQYHQNKDETFYLWSGEAEVEWENGRRRMIPGESIHVPPGAIHGVTAITDCVFFEASTPHFDDRVVVEDRGVHS